MSTQQITREEKAGKIAKLHCLFTGCASLDVEELRATMLALMDYHGIQFVDIDEYRESLFRAAIEAHGSKLTETQQEEFKEWLEDRHEELTAIKGYVEMSDFFFDHTNSVGFDIYSRFQDACNKYMSFPVKM